MFILIPPAFHLTQPQHDALNLQYVFCQPLTLTLSVLSTVTFVEDKLPSSDLKSLE